MTLLLFKLVTTPTLILVATLVSRRFGQATGGWLVGLPLTSGPIALFLAIEQGPRFAQLAAAGSLHGTVAQAFFATAYVGLARRCRWPCCLAGASLAFLASGLVFGGLMLPVPALVAIACVALAAALATMGRPVSDAASAAAPRWDLPARMAVATGLVLLITSVATAIGPGMSGLAATFPLFATVLAVFAHRHQGAPAAQSVLRGLLLGLFGFTGFFATISLLVTRVGLPGTFAAALAVNLLISAAAYPALRRRAG
ncbi:MAG: hypothetical protein U1F58_04795 [Burkholderiales bacterium]